MFALGVTPEGSGALPFGPKNHSNTGQGTLVGKGIGSTRVTEHINETVSPAMLGPEGERVIFTGLG
jgi:hypothetical protein